MIKIIFLVFIHIASIPVFAIENNALDLVQFWMNIRFQSCDLEYTDILVTQNPGSLTKLSQNECKNLDLKNINDPKVILCFKTIESTLKYSLENYSAKPEKYNCKVSSNFKDYLNGDQLKSAPAVTNTYSSIDVCTPADSYKFKIVSVDHVNTCTNKFKCSQKFQFGKSTLEPGTYSLRCLTNVSSQADCDQVSLANCAGKELSYAEWKYFGAIQSGSTKVAPSGSTR